MPSDVSPGLTDRLGLIRVPFNVVVLNLDSMAIGARFHPKTAPTPSANVIPPPPSLPLGAIAPGCLPPCPGVLMPPPCPRAIPVLSQNAMCLISSQ
ncbi:hypothetical protein EJB05_28774, partial [Eragrostis curvula]